MISTDLIVVAPWVIFGIALIAVCIQLLRARRASKPTHRRRPDQEDEECSKKNETARRR
jgi:hypothetical protein